MSEEEGTRMRSIRTEPVTGPSVWRREDVEDPAEWTYELSGASLWNGSDSLVW